MKASYNGKYGELGGTVSVLFTSRYNFADRKTDTISKFQTRLAFALNLSGEGEVRPATEADYDADGSVVVALDNSFKILDSYHGIRPVTETWTKCRNVLLDVDYA